MFCSQSARSVTITTDWPSGDTFTVAEFDVVKKLVKIDFGLVGSMGRSKKNHEGGKKPRLFGRS